MIGVIKVGSAIFANPDRKHIEILTKFEKDFKGDLVFVSGAGPMAKKMLKEYRKFGFSEGFLDHLGIELTHVNAQALSRLLNGVYCRTFNEIDAHLGNRPITGGQVPGQSTDAVAAELADYLGADMLFLVKDVGGIYSKDPKENPGARILHKITIGQLEELMQKKTKAGDYGVIDPQAFSIIKRTEMRTFVVGPELDFEEGTEIQKKLKESLRMF